MMSPFGGGKMWKGSNLTEKFHTRNHGKQRAGGVARFEEFQWGFRPGWTSENLINTVGTYICIYMYIYIYTHTMIYILYMIFSVCLHYERCLCLKRSSFCLAASLIRHLNKHLWKFNMWNQQCFFCLTPGFIHFLLYPAVQAWPKDDLSILKAGDKALGHRRGQESPGIWKAKRSRKPTAALGKSLRIAVFAKVEYYSKTHQHFVEGEVLEVEHNEAGQ